MPERPQTAGQYLPVPRTENVGRYLLTEPLVLDYESGMPLLILYGDDAPEIIYIDRAVRLEPGTCFSLMPVKNDGQVFYAGALPAKPVDTIPRTAIEGPGAQVIVEDIHTFFYQESHGNFYFRGERHTPYELVYVDRGCLHTLAGGRDVPLCRQGMMILGSNTWHIQYSDEPVSFLTISFSLSQPVLSSLTDRALDLTVPMKNLIAQILRERGETPYATECRESLLRLLLVQLLRAELHGAMDAPAEKKAEQAENAMIDRAVQYISGHIGSRLPLEEVAGELNISVSYLCRLFSRHLGIAPGKYITRIRIEESKALLREGHSIGTIAEIMGFSSPQHFSKQFHELVGITPTQYSRSLR